MTTQHNGVQKSVETIDEGIGNLRGIVGHCWSFQVKIAMGTPGLTST